MSDFAEPQRRRRKRPDRRYQDPASMPLDDQLARLQQTLLARRDQYYETPGIKASWLEQLRCASAIMHGAPGSPQCFKDKDHTHEYMGGGAAAQKTTDNPSIHIVCLGIGKISESRESQYQFLQLQDIASFWETKDVWVYDPLLEPLDILLIERSGYGVIRENLLGGYTLPKCRPALAYLPHCPRALYEAFIRTNCMANGLGWSSAPSQSQDVVSAHEGRHMLIANDFTQYTLSLPEKTFAAENPFLSRIATLVDVVDLPNISGTHSAFPAFSSLAWQYLPGDKVLSPDAIATLQQSSPPTAKTTGEMVISEIGQTLQLGFAA